MMVKNIFLGLQETRRCLGNQRFFFFCFFFGSRGVCYFTVEGLYVYTLGVWLCVVVSVCITLTVCDGLSLDGTTRAI